MINASASQFHINLPWGQCPCPNSVLNVKALPSRGLLRDYEPSNETFSSTILAATVCPVLGRPAPAVHEAHEAVLLAHPADVDQPAAVQRALGPRLLPAVELVREEVFVASLRGSAVFRGGF